MIIVCHTAMTTSQIKEMLLKFGEMMPTDLQGR